MLFEVLTVCPILTAMKKMIVTCIKLSVASKSVRVRHPSIPIKKAPHRGALLLVPVAGLEPARCRQRWILSPLRLPIPSHRQINLTMTLYIIIYIKSSVFCWKIKEFTNFI